MCIALVIVLATSYAVRGAISYRVLLTALLTFVFCTWVIMATTLGYIDLSHVDQSLVLSISMGLH